MTLKILPSAVDDLQRGVEFYDEQGAGLGQYFQDCLCSDIDSLGIYAGIHPEVLGYFRLLSKRFPYAIYYRMPDSDTTVVWRVLDLRARPGVVAKELEP